MFVRFRERNARLLVSLAESRRRDGKVRQEHVADLGSINMLEASAEDRVAFWRRLHERLSRLGNRIDPAKLGAILAAINARVPMATVDELPAVRVGRAERSLRQWRLHLEGCQEQVALHQQLKADVERKIDQWTKEAARAQANAEAAQAALVDPAKPVPPDLSRAEINRILRGAGITKQKAHRMRKLAAMSDEEFEQRYEFKRSD
jgi:hypothetical protein